MKRAKELGLPLGPRPAETTLQHWLSSELRAAILAGRIAPGQRLPSTRDFARQHAVSRGTVLAVYEQLIAEGYLAGSPGSGTTALAALPLGARTANAPVLAAPGSVLPRLSRQGRLLAHSPFADAEGVTPLRPFRPNQPDLRFFPLAIWRRLTARYGRERLPEEMGYGSAAGYAPLRRAIAEHLGYSQRIACQPEQVMILPGAQPALDMCARLLLNPEDAALVEDPGYPGAARLFAATGAQVLGVPVDGHGLCIEPPLPVAENIRLAYVTAAHQSPLGGVLPLERRLALLAWADQCNATIIEDDYDGEYRFNGAPMPALKSLDQADRVIYMGTFSKLLFPAMRLAYLVLPQWLVEPFTAALSLSARHAPVLSQAVLADFIAHGHFARHLRHMRQCYGERAACFQSACARRLAGALTVPEMTTGLDATALLPPAADDRAVAAALVGQGIEARPISFYRVALPATPGLVMGVSAFDPAEIERGVEQMARVLDAAL